MNIVGGPWLLLLVAIGIEVLGTISLKLSDGFAKWHWGVAAIVFYAVCFVFLAQVLKSIPVGITYAIWSGAGIIAMTLIGLLVFKEHIGGMQLVFMGFVLVGCAGLRLTTSVA